MQCLRCERSIPRTGIARAVVAMFALPLHPARQSAPGAIGGPVDGNVKIGLSILNHYIRTTGSGYLDMTALILSAARTIDIGKTNGNLAHVVIGPVEREMDAPFNVLAQARS